MQWNNWNGNTCFKYFSDTVNRDDAESFCQSEGGRLFNIRMFYDFQGLNSLQQHTDIYVCISVKKYFKGINFHFSLSYGVKQPQVRKIFVGMIIHQLTQHTGLQIIRLI
jgi:hypothetical protein